jgi:hypothetical protein
MARRRWRGTAAPAPITAAPSSTSASIPRNFVPSLSDDLCVMIDKMPAQTTVEDILALFREAEQRLRENERIAREDRAETERLFREHERLRNEERAEAERLRKEAERLSKEAERRREQERAEAERLRAQERAETERFLRDLGKQLGALGNRLGDFVEEMVAPTLVSLLQERGIAVTQVSRRTSSKRQGAAMEVDLLAVNDTDVVAVEVKSRLSDDDVRRQLERLGKFKMAFPQYRGYRVLGAVAAMVVPDEIGRQAQDAGLFVLAPSGEAMRILNDEAFEPKAW